MAKLYNYGYTITHQKGTVTEAEREAKVKELDFATNWDYMKGSDPHIKTVYFVEEEPCNPET